MRLETFYYQRFLRYKYNVYRSAGYLPAAGLMAYWIFENGFHNLYSYVINPPKPGVPKRQEGEEIED